jgi:hypothetical protein
MRSAELNAETDLSRALPPCPIPPSLSVSDCSTVQLGSWMASVATEDGGESSSAFRRRVADTVFAEQSLTPSLSL